VNILFVLIILKIAFSTRFEAGHKFNEKATSQLRENLFAAMKKSEQ